MTGADHTNDPIAGRQRWLDRLGYIFAGAVVLVVLYGVFVMAPGRRAEVLEQWRVRLEAMAHDRERALESWLSEMQMDTRMVARFPSVRQWALSGERGHASLGHVRDILQQTTAGENFEAAWLLDAAGQVTVAPEGLSSTYSRAAVQQFGRDVLRGGPLVALVQDVRGDALVLFGATIPGPSGHSGVLVVETMASGFVFQLIDTEPVPTRTGEAQLVQLEGDSIVFLSALRHRPEIRPLSLRLPRTELLAAAVAAAGENSFGEYRDYRGVHVVAATAPLSNAPWGLVVKVDAEEALAAYRSDLLHYAGFSAAVLFSLGMLLFALRSQHVSTIAITRREGERRLRQIAANAADMMYRFRLQPQPGFDYVNAAIERVLGYSPQECYDDPKLVRRNVYPEDRELLAELTKNPRAGAPTRVRCYDRRGILRHIELVNVPVFDEHDRLIAIEGVARDVTQQAETDRALRESEARHRALFETAEQGVIYLDVASGTRTLNPAAREILGLSPEDGAEQLELFQENGRAVHADEVLALRALETGVPVPPRVLRAVNRRSGADRWLLAGATPMYREGEQQPYLVYTIFTDITALRDAETELRDTREMYRAVVENTTDVIARFDRDCRYLYVNPACQLYARFSPADLIGRTNAEAGHAPDICEKWDTTIRAVFADGLPREDAYTLPGPNGVHHLVWRLFPEFDADGAVRTVVTWSSDVTAQRHLEAQYQQAQKMEAVGRLAGGVAHDFNNLITAISGYGAMALEQLPAEEPVRADVEEIVRASERAAALTRQLLAFSRKQVLKVDVLDLGAIVSSMDRMLRRLIGEDVQLLIVHDRELWPVLADAGQVEQVIMNLAVNARDAMPGGGTLAISVRNRTLRSASAHYDPPAGAGDYISIEVADTGTGMSADTLEHLYEPFFTTKEKGKGTGLGLSTVYGIIRQSGGTIRVDSRTGAGTTFEILLPRAPATTRERRTASDAQASIRTGERILVVEDEAAVRLLTQRMLERAGFRVRLADSGDQALALDFPPDEPIDLLLTDVVMPGMSGRELALRFRKRFPHVRVLYMSGYTDDVIASHGLLEPGVSLLQKPFTYQSLQNAVRATLDQAPALF